MMARAGGGFRAPAWLDGRMLPGQDESDEGRRLASLLDMAILDSVPSEEFDAIVALAARICGTPISLISLVDADRQWFKANHGLTGTAATSRELAFCDHTIRGEDILEVADATLDERFAGNALVTGEPGVRFYAGMPLCLGDGTALGSLCVIDRSPRRLDENQRQALRDLGRTASWALRSWAERHRCEQREALHAADRRRLGALIEAFGVGTWEWNVQSGELRTNDAWIGLLGWRPADHHDLRRAFHADDLADVDCALEAHLSGQTDRYRVEARMRHAGGHYVWTQSQGTLIGRDDDRRPAWIFGFVKDITEQREQEETLRRSQQFLKQTSEFAGVGGWEIELETGEMHWTPEAFRIAAVPQDRQPTAEEALQFYAPEDRPRILEARRHAIATGQPYEFEVQYNRADGKCIWVRSFGAAVFEDGRAVRLVGAIQNAEVQVAQSLALQAAHHRMTLAANSGGIGLFDWDIIADTLYWDDWMCRLYGIARPGIHDTFRVWGDRLHPDDRSAGERAIRDAIEGHRPYDIEFRVIWTDGSIHRLHAVGTVIRDARGRALRMVGTNRDVTKPRQMAIDLLRQHEMLRVTLHSIGDAVVTTDSEGRIGWLNPLAERLTGWPAAEAAGKLKIEVVHLIDEATRADRPDLVPLCLQTGRVLSQEPNAILVSRYGSECPIENTLSPIRDAVGAVLGVVIVFRDVSIARRVAAERKDRELQLGQANAELERLARHFAKARTVAEQASQAKTRFLASMSHELRTPLNGILGYAQLLEMDGGLTPVQSDRVQAMLSAGNHLLDMISCILDLSEIETESVELHAASLDIAGLAEALLNIVRPAAARKSLSLQAAIAPDVPRNVTADPTRLRQILLNLLGNAVKYTASGSVTLRITLPSCAAAATPKLRFEIEDSGPGISAELQHRLFGEYDRLGASVLASIEGAGLGLSLAKRLAALLGGDLGYRPNADCGSVFWFEMPVQAGAMAGQATPLALPGATPAPSGLPVQGALPILVVDDVAMNRDIAAAFLQSAAHAVVCAAGGAEAVRLAARGDFLAILMDVRMPDVDGLEASRRIRALGGRRSLVPIVALTAQVFAEQVAACREAGMDTHLAKPFTLDTLLGAVARGAAMAQERIARHDALPPTPPDACACPAKDCCGAPVLDGAVFDRISAILETQATDSYLVQMTEKLESLSLALASGDLGGAQASALAEAAHALAGSAGMFGFERLVQTARQFERAVRTGDCQMPAAASCLGLALTASLDAMRERISPAAAAPF